MNAIDLVLYVVALCCFIGAAASIPTRTNLTAAGLAVLVLSLLIP